METKLLLYGLLLGSCVAFGQDTKSELQQTVQQQGIAQELADAPDGVTIRLLPNGGFQIFAVGTGTYDLDDVDDIADAQKEATLKAKANLAKFMNESLSTDEKLEEMSKKVKSISSKNGETSAKVEKKSAKSTLASIRSSSAALLKGVITLSSAKLPGKGTSGTYRVMVGVSSKTLEAVGRLVEGTGAAGSSAAAEPAQQAAPAADATGGEPGAGGAAALAGGLPPGWIECIGNGSDRRAAVAAALTEGIEQVYGLALQNDSKMKERMKKLKVNTNVLRVSSKETESSTLTKTAGFVKEYRIIEVREIGGGRMEARIHALIINPRAGGVVAVMLYKPDMPLEDVTKNYDVGPKRRLSGNDIAAVVGKTFNRAFAAANKFLVLDMDDLEKVVGQQKMSAAMVESGLAPAQELLKAGQMLTADYILTSTIEDMKYSRKIGMNKKTKKFGPVYKMSIRLNYKLTNVTTGQTLVSEVISESLSSEEIAALLEEDEDADLLLALMGKITERINRSIPQQK